MAREQRAGTRGAWPRRALTFGGLALAWLALVATAPLTIVLAALMGVVRRRRFAELRMLAIAVAYTTLELVGLLVALAIGPFGRGSARWLARHYALQAWWANALFAVAVRTLRLDVRVEGLDAVGPGPILLFIRHASLADVLLPAALVTRGRGIRLRYVLKRELLVDPCLDLVGNRLPNHFVRRSDATAAELEAVGALARGLGPSDGVLLYPEGTRFTPEKQRRGLAALEARGSGRLEVARRLRHTLLPKKGGALALLDAAPDVDVVFCSHAGFEGFARFEDLLSGAVVGRTLWVRFFRVPAADVPRDEAGRVAWLDEQWQRVDALAAPR